jgi:ribonuclease Z
MCYGNRFEAEGKVVGISGDTVDCEGLAQLTHGADLLVHCCDMASAEIENEHLRHVARHTLAAGDTVGKIAGVFRGPSTLFRQAMREYVSETHARHADW